MMLLVTCANGNVGRKIIPYLVKAGFEIKAMDMNPSAINLKELGVKEVFIGDGNNSKDVKKAFENVDQVLYIPPLFIHCETHMAQLAIDEASNANIKQFVMMSVMHPNMSTLLQHTAKLKAEEYLVYKGLSNQLNYTILQPMHYHHNFNVPMVQQSGAYTCFYTKTTKLSYVDCEDVAEVACKVLSEHIHANATYELCGPDFLSPCEMSDIYHTITKTKISTNEIDIEDFIRMIHLEDSYGKDTFRNLSQTYGTYGIAGNPNVLTWLLGRRPTTFKEYIERELQK